MRDYRPLLSDLDIVLGEAIDNARASDLSSSFTVEELETLSSSLSDLFNELDSEFDD